MLLRVNQPLASVGIEVKLTFEVKIPRPQAFEMSVVRIPLRQMLDIVRFGAFSFVEFYRLGDTASTGGPCNVPPNLARARNSCLAVHFIALLGAFLPVLV